MNSPTHAMTTVVIGAAGGIGKAITSKLATAGHHVVAIDRSDKTLEDLVKSIPESQLTTYRCDITSESEVERVAEDVEAHQGRISGLVNSAAIMSGGDGLESVDVHTWRNVLDVNLTGTFLCLRAFGSQMLDRGGAVVNISSAAGIVPGPFRGAYSVSKAGVLMLTQQAAVEWGPRNVRVNAVCPGLVITPMSEHQYTNHAKATDRVMSVPMRRVAAVDEIADTVVYLLSNASTYVNGAILCVDGGLHVAGFAGINAV